MGVRYVKYIIVLLSENTYYTATRGRNINKNNNKRVLRNLEEKNVPNKA